MEAAAPAGESVRLQSRADGFSFEAYHVRTSDARRGGLVLIHEIFGLIPDIRALADSFADEGYETIAPSIFDRAHPGFQGDAADLRALARGRSYAARTDWTATLGDVQACIDALAPPAFVVGFCFGGAIAWRAAAHCQGLSAASCLYGRQIVDHLADQPRCPTILHYGKADPLIAQEDVERVRAAHPDLPVWLYDAGHAFMAPRAYVADAARLARLRTLQLFHRSAGAKGEMGG